MATTLTRLRRFPLFLLPLSLAACASSGSSTTPQTSQPHRGGYSIRLVSVTPPAGTRVRVGQRISLTLVADYELQAADTGNIVLVLQKPDNTSLIPGRNQVSKPVSRGSGRVTLTDEFEVPTGTTAVRLFVPLAPTGYTVTSGELLIEYPVR